MTAQRTRAVHSLSHVGTAWPSAPLGRACKQTLGRARRALAFATGCTAAAVAASPVAQAARAFLANVYPASRGAAGARAPFARVAAPFAANAPAECGIVAPSSVKCGTARSASATPFVGLGSPRVVAASSLVTAIALAAAQARRRRKRRAPAPSPTPTLTEEDAAAVTAQGVALTGIAAEAAAGLSMTDADRKRRKEQRKLRKLKMANKEPKKQDRNMDPAIKELLEGEDPQFFGAPYIWVQLAHAIISITAIAVAIFGDNGELEFALFDLSAPYIEAVRTGVTNVLLLNILLAFYTFGEELRDSEKFWDAVGWGLKVLFIGGVATWQRNWRLRPKPKEDDGEKAATAKA